MLSRVANNIYWMQRYRERAENIARILEVQHILSSDVPEEEMHWEALLHTFNASELFRENYSKMNRENIIDFITFNRNNPGSLISSVEKSRETARMIREIITTEMWQELNTIYLYIQKESVSQTRLKDPYFFFNRVKRQCQLFTGIADSTLSHDQAWHFYRIGGLFERADMTSRLLDVKYYLLLPAAEKIGSPYDNIQWNTLLKSLSGLEMYRRKWRHVSYAQVIQFLILDKLFPRSIFSCLERSLFSMEIISANPRNKYAKMANKSLLNLIEKLKYMNHADIIQYGVHELVDFIQISLMEINNQIFDAYFNNHIETPFKAATP